MSLARTLDTATTRSLICAYVQAYILLMDVLRARLLTRLDELLNQLLVQNTPPHTLLQIEASLQEPQYGFEESCSRPKSTLRHAPGTVPEEEPSKAAT